MHGTRKRSIRQNKIVQRTKHDESVDSEDVNVNSGESDIDPTDESEEEENPLHHHHHHHNNHGHRNVHHRQHAASDPSDSEVCLLSIYIEKTSKSH